MNVTTPTFTVVVAARGAPGPAGVPGVSGDHSALSNLTNDDHPQYHNNARGDARYDLLGAASTAQAAAISAASTDATTKSNAAQTAAQAYADTLVVGLIDDRGNYNASGNTFPASGGSGSAGAVLKGDLWTVSAGGTIGGSVVEIGDLVRALTNAPGQTASNWAITQNNIGYVPTSAAIVPSTVPSAGQILVGNAGGTAYAPVSISGDITITSAGVVAIGAGKVTEAMHVFTDSTTGNSSASQHGFLPKLSGNSTDVFTGTGTWVSQSSGNPFVDSAALVKGSADATKQLRFEVDGFTTSTLRVLTPPNADATIAGLEVAQSFTALQTLSAGARIASGQTLDWNNDTFLSRRAAAGLAFGAADAAAPVAQTISFQGSRGGTDSNVAAVATTFQGSLGTGNAAAGDIVFKTGAVQASGTTQHVATTRLTINASGLTFPGNWISDANHIVDVSGGWWKFNVFGSTCLKVDSNSVDITAVVPLKIALPLQPLATISTIASASTINPTAAWIQFVSGTTAIDTITTGSPSIGLVCFFIPTGAFTWTTAGNIAVAGTAVVNRLVIFTYSATTAKWYPSYV
jgi:hypothetical protein